MIKCFIHVDLDAFYASVEQLDNPEYKGKPVIVGSLPTDRRGVVSTCSYEARAYGVHSAMPIGNAVKLCPHAIFLRGRMKRYQEKSKEIMSIFSDFSPDVHQISVDEAFIDITGTERLFGPPEQVASLLKSRILEQTGLTVSIGISTTKYIAKIASGMNKPNGLFIVHKGDEEKFMLNLPLKDIWGIGQKTLHRIKQAGFNSTQDLHAVSKGMLINLFGNSTGEFLFNAVRGTLFETFNEAPKTRSISSERTFRFDLTDRYAIDTALMELSWDVMFRVFTEKWTSKTAHVKIRYEDFTTVSVQETSTRAISSADDLYMRVKKLFDKKYENGRGIRLIGIAAQNLENTSLPTQQELFDSGDKKKAAIEKTVIELQKKNPGLQIQKARLLRNSLLVLTSLFFLLNIPYKGFTQNNNPIELAKPFEDAFISGEAPIAMFNLSPESSQVEFFAEGTWEAMFTGFMNISGGDTNEGNASLSFDPPVFIQKTDLTVWFLLQDTWYFEANIADNYDNNTVAAGYYGEDYLRHARIGNRNITFSQDYGVTDADRGVGSGSNQAPGIMAQWEGIDWRADAIFRYDITESLEKTWLGQYESNENNIELTQWENGARFIFPGNTVEKTQYIYVESTSSNITLYKDLQGKTYKRLSPSEYLIIPSKNMIILDSPTEKNVLITYQDTLPEIGTFNPPTGFLGDIQSWFGSEIALEDFSLSQDGFKTIIDGKNALVIQSKNFFSPFVDASLYSLSSFTNIDSVSIVSESSGITDKQYGSIVINSSSLEVPGFASNDIFEDKKSYIQVFYQNDSDSSIAMTQFPFANTHPNIYLTTGALSNVAQNQNDLEISVLTLTSASVLDIGPDAISGTISVYRNGVNESLFRYDSNTGLVTLSSPPGTFDTIRITWKENSETGSLGSVTAAAGFEKDFTNSLSMNASSSILWPVVEQDSFSDASTQTEASFNIALETNYRNDNLTIGNTLYTSIQSTDVTDTYRIDGMSNSQSEEVYLASSANVASPENFVPILNTRSNDTTAQTLLSSLEGSISSNTRRDSINGGYTVYSEWEIENNSGWVAQTIDLHSGSKNLPSAKTFSINIKQSEIDTAYKIFLQLGVDTNESELFEQSGEIPTWELTEGSDVLQHFVVGNTIWQTVTVQLEDSDRAKLIHNQNARIIIVTPSTGVMTKNGTLEVGPYIIGESSFSVSNNELYSEEVYQIETEITELPTMTRFNDTDRNTVQYFKWDDTSTPETLSAAKFFSPLPLDSYKKINFFAYVPTQAKNSSSVTITLNNETEFSNETVFELELLKSALDLLQSTWHTVSVNILSNEVSVDTILLPQNAYTLKSTDNTVSPTKMLIEFTGAGEIYFDEFHFSDAIWNVITENIFDVIWEKNENIVVYNEIPIISNAKIESSVRAGISEAINSDESQTELALTTDSNASVEILGIETEGSLIFTSSNTLSSVSNENRLYYIESASHAFSTTPAFSLFNILGFKEEYRYLPQSNSAKKSELFSVDFSPLGTNLLSSFSTDAEKESNAYNQDVQIKTDFSVASDNISYTLASLLQASQTGYMTDSFVSSYIDSWTNTTKIQFSNGYANATTRELLFSLEQILELTPLSFSPSFYVEGKNVYSNTTNVLNASSDTMRLLVPFTIGSNTFTATLSRASESNNTNTTNNSYISDAEFFLKTVQDRTWAYITIPIYDFFDKGIRNNMVKAIAQNSNISVLGYTSEISLDWKRRFFSNSFDFIIPTQASLSLFRDIRSSSSDTNDIFQITSNISFLSINNFGKLGNVPIFDWYEQDEIVQSIKLSYELDNLEQENTRLDISGYNQISLYFSDNGKISTITEGRIDTDNEWLIKIDTIWERDGKSSLLVDGFFYLFPELLGEYKGFTRENSITASLINASDDNDERVFQQFYGISHNIELQVNEYAAIGLDLGSELTLESDSFSLRNSFSLTGKLQF